MERSPQNEILLVFGWLEKICGWLIGLL